MYGNDYRYAATRLDDTIARLDDGTPVYIASVYGDGNVRFFTLEELASPDQKEKHLPLKRFNLEPVPLGYLNGKAGCSYISRMPVRKWKQGLRVQDNVHSSNGMGFATDYVALSNTIMNKYPKFKDIFVEQDKTKNPFNKVGAKNKLKAWHRHWAVDGTKVYYRNDYVGDVVDGVVKLSPSYKYLQECLEESL